MEVNLRVNNECFEEILNYKRNFITHGFSSNKKYLRLFNHSGVITLYNENKTQSIIKQFISIVIEYINNKKSFKLIFE